MDQEVGILYEFIVYFYIVVAIFVNWLDILNICNLVEVLFYCYQDRWYGFYVWCNCWKDDNDIIIMAFI